MVTQEWCQRVDCFVHSKGMNIHEASSLATAICFYEYKLFYAERFSHVFQ